jgi:murein tripeptide amidase MpaA
MTLEMPFKDDANNPSEQFGWSPARCKQLGATALDPINRVVLNLR